MRNLSPYRLRYNNSSRKKIFLIILFFRKLGLCFFEERIIIVRITGIVRIFCTVIWRSLITAGLVFIGQSCFLHKPNLVVF
ncbi:MAG: hypothetical protein LBJ00_05860 [Planctomycetaceae bacterium]|nr:hypothetical protein [Planctomycetaceae bacterium]